MRLADASRTAPASMSSRGESRAAANRNWASVSLIARAAPSYVVVRLAPVSAVRSAAPAPPMNIRSSITWLEGVTLTVSLNARVSTPASSSRTAPVRAGRVRSTRPRPRAMACTAPLSEPPASSPQAPTARSGTPSPSRSPRDATEYPK